MILGGLLIGKSAATNYYSPWFPRGGNGAKMTCEVIADNGLDSFKILVETKNSDQGDNSATELNGPNGETITLGTVYNRHDFDVGDDVDGGTQGCLELVRFKYIVDGPASGIGWVHFRMLEPQWLTNGA